MAAYCAAAVTVASEVLWGFFPDFLLADFFDAAFFATVAFEYASARFAAQRLLVASLIAFLPAALSVLFCLAGLDAASDDVDSASPLILAYLGFCAAAILRRPAALAVTTTGG